MKTNTINNQNQESAEMLDDIILKCSLASKGNYLSEINKNIDWNEMTDFIFSNSDKFAQEKYDKLMMNILIKCMIFGKIFKCPDYEIPAEAEKNTEYKDFFGIKNRQDLPGVKQISAFRSILIHDGLYEKLIEKFYNQLNIIDMELNNNPAEISENAAGSEDSGINPETENKINLNINDKLYVKMFDMFFDKLDVSESDEILSETELKNHELTKKIKYVDEIIKKLKNKAKIYDEDERENHLSGINYKSEIKNKEPIEIRPGFKTEGIFNDENLTEDYELGYRFHQLGLKMGFFNVKLDNNNESSRISTAEFFPNTFWSSVKQRSRWIAGICLQNWKAHKWKGNLTMKYFLFRDRKPLFSLFGAFLSNIILFYLIYTIVTNLLFGGEAVFLVSHSSVLYYIMAANVFFMLSRACHRFIFTYNWYGFRYAFFSFVRLIVDTAINFFAVLRSLSVYRKTKKKVIWDATSHY